MPKILIADDYDKLREQIGRTLAVEGYTILEAGNGMQAVELFQTEKPDVVLLDLGIPGKDGLTVLKEIRVLNPDAKVAILASPGQQNDVLQAVRAGAMEYFIKPLDPARMTGVIHRMMGLSP
jgi:two-component system chemotaxis response regulator CheY